MVEAAAPLWARDGVVRGLTTGEFCWVVEACGTASNKIGSRGQP